MERFDGRIAIRHLEMCEFEIWMVRGRHVLGEKSSIEVNQSVWCGIV